MQEDVEHTMSTTQCEMTCAQVGEAVYWYVDCAMPADWIPAFYEHLAHCEDCRLHVTCYRKVVSLLADERSGRMSPSS